MLRLDTARRADGTFDEAFLAGLRAALHGIGFLQLTGYGATPGQIGALTAAAARFFALPLEERLRLDNRLSPHFRGYTRLGHEITAGRADAREQIDFAPEQAPVPRELWDAPYRLLEGPNQWPDDTVPELRPLVGQWAGLLSAIGREPHPGDRRGAGTTRRPFRPVLRRQAALVRQADPLRRGR